MSSTILKICFLWFLIGWYIILTNINPFDLGGFGMLSMKMPTQILWDGGMEAAICVNDIISNRGAY